MAKAKKLSVRGDRRKIVRAKHGHLVPVFTQGKQTTSEVQALASANRNEIISLITYANNELLPLVQRLSTDLQKISTEAEVLGNRMDVMERDSDRRLTESLPRFNLYPTTSDDDEPEED